MTVGFSQSELFFQMQMAACYGGHHFRGTQLLNAVQGSAILGVSPRHLQGTQLNTAQVFGFFLQVLGLRRPSHYTVSRARLAGQVLVGVAVHARPILACRCEGLLVHSARRVPWLLGNSLTGQSARLYAETPFIGISNRSRQSL